MSPGHENCILLLILSVCTSMCSCSQLLSQICVSASNCFLECLTDNNSSDVQSREVTWYKIRDFVSSGVSGRILLNSTNSLDVDPQSHHLLLPDVTCVDAGLYTCQVTTAADGESWLGRVLLTVTDCSDNEETMTDFYWLILASAVLMLALLTFLISNLILKNVFKERKISLVKDVVKNSPFKPLDQQELKSVHTLGSKTCTTNHVWV
ncbi:uncharacterized protein LOC107989439 [Cynoglossus semilaevis]|uniref:Uncharacterized LOC107989439 n=1 Tax=Cynoglossus semilaevis TaxID=244447 RepID=A0A3P8UF26_CYNSE|nr:uncharacterized protein LOC107989439 [Cynoglossus semilaevis]